MSDRLHGITDYKKFKKDLAHMHELIDAGKGNELLPGYLFFPMTPKRFISLFAPGTTEDVFDYGEQEPNLKYFSRIKLPLLVHLAGADEAADRPIQEIQKAFDTHAKSPTYKSVIIQGALHRFNGHEQEAVAAIVGWARTI
jgi:alpha-beta hydrolase superfamily lysophospholipase